MTSRAKTRKAEPSPATTVVRHARDLADAGDRWFLSVAGGLGRIGDWALREADIAKDSAAAAFTTTVSVARRLTGLRALEARHANDAEPEELEEPAAEERAPTTDDPGLDLVAAVPVRPGPKRRRKRRVDGDASSEVDGPGHPAGVVPLLQALGRTVADHTQRGYTTLEEDERFWTLIHLLQLLSRPIVPPRFPAAPTPHPDAQMESSSQADGPKDGEKSS